MINKTMPKILYHYTTQDGLIGILKENALWATKIHYMNDASELIEPLRIANAQLTTFASQLDAEGAKGKKLIKKEITLRILDDIRVWEHTNICVASFCTKGDLLSQWRGYGIPGSAYSIGFDRENLVKTIGSHPFELRRCQYYDPSAYQQKIHQFILEIINEAIKENNIPQDFIGKFLNMAATMKFDCFQEEREWRFVSWKPLNFTDERFNFKTSKSMIIPYYSLPLDLSSIVEIIVGPCQHPELAEDAIHGLAHKFNLKNVLQGKVYRSQVPYRIF